MGAARRANVSRKTNQDAPEKKDKKTHKSFKPTPAPKFQPLDHHAHHHYHHSAEYHGRRSVLNLAALDGLEDEPSPGANGARPTEEHSEHGHEHGHHSVMESAFSAFDSIAHGFEEVGYALSGNEGGGIRSDILLAAEEHLRDDVLAGGILTKGARSRTVEEMDEPEVPGWREKYDFVDHHWFTLSIAAVILLNTIQMGVETDYPQFRGLYVVFENLFTFIFFIEMIAKIAFRRKQYFNDSWNCLDFMLVWLSVIDVWLMPLVRTSGSDGEGPLKQFSMFRIMRIMRTLRFIRLLKVFKELWLILKGMISSVKTIFWASLLLMMLLYVAGIFCVNMVGKSGLYFSSREEAQSGDLDYFPDWDSYQYYGTVPRAMYTLFEIALEPLALRPIMEKQLYMAPFFMVYMFLTTFGVMNVIIGVIVENTQQASADSDAAFAEVEKSDRMHRVEHIKEACVLLDTDHNGYITLEELREGLQNPEISDCLVDLELPYGADENELFYLLDSDGKGEITHHKLQTNLARNIMQNDTQHMLELKGNLHVALRNIKADGDRDEQIAVKLGKVEEKYDRQSHRIDEVEKLTLEISRQMQDLIALGAGLPQKPRDCVDNHLTALRARQNVQHPPISPDYKSKRMVPPIPIPPKESAQAKRVPSKERAEISHNSHHHDSHDQNQRAESSHNSHHHHDSHDQNQRTQSSHNSHHHHDSHDQNQRTEHPHSSHESGHDQNHSHHPSSSSHHPPGSSSHHPSSSSHHPPGTSSHHPPTTSLHPKVQYEQGNTTPRSKDNSRSGRIFGEWGPSTSNDIRPSKPEVPLSPRHDQHHQHHHDHHHHDHHHHQPAIPDGAMPSIPVGSPRFEKDVDALSVDQISTGRRSNQSKWSGSQTSKMSIPPALNVLLSSADFEGFGDNGLDAARTDDLFAFLPNPDGTPKPKPPPKSTHHHKAETGYQLNITNLTSLDSPMSGHRSYNQEWQTTEDLISRVDNFPQD